MIGIRICHRISLVALLVLGLSSLATLQARAANEAREIVIKAELTAERLLSDPDYHKLQSLLKEARGVLIFPSLLKASFFFGAEGGSGVLLARDEAGEWSYPAFFTMGSVSFGLQWGGQDSEVIFVIMSDRGLRSVIEDEVKLGADASVAVGPVGIGAEAATTAKLADMYSFSRARGIFAGVSFEGAVIHERYSFNGQFYGTEVTASEIVIRRKFSNPAADKLRDILAKY